MQFTRISSASALLVACALAFGCAAKDSSMKTVHLITLDPGHFHASLVQKDMYDQVSPVVHVYAPAGPDLQEHLNRINSFNTRADQPTRWEEKIHTSPDFFQAMVADKPGNVVVLSGNNAKKARYILDCVNAGFNVLADKPMALNPADFNLIKQALATAAEKKVLLYDIMTERYEISTILQRELSMCPEVFGALEKGTPEQPAVTKESVHHFCKTVAGAALKRPAWFFDVTQQGEGIVDVTTHLVDLIQWECFPEEALDYTRDIQIITAKRWPTLISPEQFKKVTALDSFPAYLSSNVTPANQLSVYSNGEINYTLRGVHAKVSVIWNFEAPPGAKDTHYSMMRGTLANLVIKQGKEQNYQATLFIEDKSNRPEPQRQAQLDAALARIAATWPGLSSQKVPGGWQIVTPAKYSVGHEAHFAQVTRKYLTYLQQGALPSWEVPNMLAKYYTTTQAYSRSR